ncbi:MAG: ABC transporter permease [Clostridia bacterium]|nr:ABC transporter permease [Clostridia bacterium]
MKRKIFAYPYIVWMLLFILAPMLFILYYAFNINGTFTVSGAWAVFSNADTWSGLWDSVVVSLITTALCLLIGYPAAYILSRMKKSVAGLMSVLLVLPMWMNFVLRTYAWQAILRDFVPDVLGLPSIMYTQAAVMLGLVYNFLPFMILPLYTTLSKMDKSYIEAARDLGANGFVTFFRVVLPLSVPGIVSGITMVFIPSITAFTVPAMLGGGMNELYGNMIERAFKMLASEGNYSYGSSLAIVLFVCVIISTVIMNRMDKNQKEGGQLW